jgi:hypothetical protein
MAVTREIRVLRTGIELARQRLDLFRLPNGSEAAKWGGLVFPILPGDAIDVNGAGLPPAQCQLWREEVPASQFVSGPDGADSYVFIEGGAHTCRQAERRLAAAGFEVLRSGPNLSGSMGDWFIRLGLIPHDGAAKLPNLLAQLAAPNGPSDDTPLRERLLIQALVASRAAQALLRTELDRARGSTELGFTQMQEQQALADSVDSMALRLAEAEAEVAELRTRLEAAPRPVASTKANRLETELSIAATHLLPRLEFVGGSMRFVTVELPDRAILWKALAELDRQERRLPASWKSLSGHSGWWERHFSTGQDNQGRLYARTIGTPSRWQVLVSHKQEQAMDLRRIGRM